MSLKKRDDAESRDFWDSVEKACQDWRVLQPSWSRHIEEHVKNKPIAQPSSTSPDPTVSAPACETFTKGIEGTAHPPDHRCPSIGADTLHGAFVAGAKWWEYQSTGATMWASDRDKAWAEAEKRYGVLPSE